MPDRPERLQETASQTAGPYVHIGLMPNSCGIPGIFPADLGATLIDAETLGERITVRGRVIDGGNQPVTDAVVEIWQADANGFYPSPAETRGTADPHFTGWGRSATDPETGVFAFDTIKPGRVHHSDGPLMAPHISVWIVARGINLGLQTRIYFADEASANAEDPLLARIEPPERAKTLIASRQGSVYSFDIRLQGDGETVFLDM